jgi:competence CoiA-like predicted nuclease
MNLTCDEDLTQHQAGELHRSNFEVLQSRQGAAGLTAKSTPESSHRPRLHPISNNDMESEQPKRSALGQEHEAEAKNSHTVQLVENKIQRRQKTREALGEEHKAEEKDSHAEQLMKESGIQNREQQKPAEPTFRDDTYEHRQSPHALSVKEKSPSNEHKIVAFNKVVASPLICLLFFASICSWNVCNISVV